MENENNITFTPFSDNNEYTANRRRLSLISQVPDEIIADVMRYEALNASGTPINANTLNSRFNEIKNGLENIVIKKVL